MKPHVWKNYVSPGTPDNPTEYFTVCERCGQEFTDTEQDDTPCDGPDNPVPLAPLPIYQP